MPLLGFGVTFLGYAVFYYGLTQVRGGNWGLLDLIVPGKFDPSVAMDSGGSANGSGYAPGSVGGPPAALGTAGAPPAITQTPSQRNSGSGATSSGSPGVGITQTPAGPLA